jgi:putative hydrolase of the HAD superfamily
MIVLFDAVGTLIAPHPSVAEAYHAAGLRFGSSLTVDSIRLRFRSAFTHQETQDSLAAHRTSEPRERERWRAIIAEVFHDVPDTEDLFETLWDHFAQPAHWRIYDDVADCCEKLTQAGYVIGIASNFDARLDGICSSHTPFAACGLAATAKLFVSSRIGHKKPSLEFFRAIERSLESPPEQIVLVGDDLENDFHAARRAGWQAVLLKRDGETQADLTAAPIIRTLGELPGVLSASSGPR